VPGRNSGADPAATLSGFRVAAGDASFLSLLLSTSALPFPGSCRTACLGDDPCVVRRALGQATAFQGAEHGRQPSPLQLHAVRQRQKLAVAAARGVVENRDLSCVEFRHGLSPWCLFHAGPMPALSPPEARTAMRKPGGDRQDAHAFVAGPDNMHASPTAEVQCNV